MIIGLKVLIRLKKLKNAKSSEERSIIRSKTFPGIAKAMAEQWTNEDRLNNLGDDDCEL